MGIAGIHVETALQSRPRMSSELEMGNWELLNHGLPGACFSNSTCPFRAKSMASANIRAASCDA